MGKDTMKINLFLIILALGSMGSLCAMDDNGAGPALQVAISNGTTQDRKRNTLFNDPNYFFQDTRAINDVGVTPANISLLLTWCANTFSAQKAQPADRLLSKADVTHSIDLKLIRLNLNDEFTTLEMIRKQVDAVFLAIQAPNTRHNTQNIRAQLKIVYLQLHDRYIKLKSGLRSELNQKLIHKLAKEGTIEKIIQKLVQL